MYFLKSLLVTIVLMTNTSTINDSLIADSCFPENDLYISADNKMMTMSKETFDHVIDVVEEVYSPIIKERGGELQVERKWESGTVNAYAQRVGKIYKVSMFGGLARHKTVTPDGFALVVCHEVGHHIGGAPKKKSWWGSAWASNEGQADYWGTTKCLKKVFKILKEEEQDYEDKDYIFAEKECDKRFEDQEGKALCLRASMAGKSLAGLFKDLRKMKKDIHFYTPSKKKVSKTFHSHPAAQCRMDTYFAGSLCSKSVEDEVSDTDESKGVCYRGQGFELEARPLCWFKSGSK